MGECLSQAALIVAELRLRDAKVSPDAVAFGAIAGGQAFQGVEHGSRPVVIPREHRLPYSRAFQVDLGWELGVQHDAKTQPPVSAKRHTGRLAGVLRQGFKPIGEDGGKVVVRINPASDGDGIADVVFGGFHVRAEPGQPLGQARDGSRQVAHATAGDVLFIEMVLFQEVKALQLGVGLGESENRRVAGGDGLDLGVGEFLAADVLGTARAFSPVMTCEMNRALVSRACHI